MRSTGRSDGFAGAARVTLRAAVRSAGWGLRAYWGTAALIAAGGAAMLAAALPVAGLVRSPDGSVQALTTRLLLVPLQAEVAETGWALARTPASLQAEAVGVLFQAVGGIAMVAFAVGALGVLLVFAARTGERTGEIALRRAVGASTRTLFLAALLEGAVLAAPALVAGVAAGLAAAQVAAKTWPGRLAAGTPVPALAVAVMAAGVMLAGAFLALAFAPRRRLTDTAPRPHGLTLPTLQLGLALVILTAGALLVRHADSAAGGERSAHGEVFQGASTVSGPERRSAAYAALLERLRSGENFETVSLSSIGAVVGLGTVGVVTTDCGLCHWGGLMVPQHSVPATHQMVSADSFQALGVQLVAGRGITDADRWDAPRVAVVSRALALRHFQDGQAIGRRLLLGDDPRVWHTVVGVVDDPPPAGLGGALQPPYTVYASVLQHPARNVELLVRPRLGRGLDRTVAPALTRALESGGVAELSEAALLAWQRAPVAWFGRFLAAEGWVTLLLATVGTLVQVRLWLGSLAPELGLRRAVGARQARILGLVLARAALVGAGGIAVGLTLGPSVWAALGTIVRDLPAWEPVVVLRYAALLVGTATIGALLPAWRASRTSPASLLASPRT